MVMLLNSSFGVVLIDMPIFQTNPRLFRVVCKSVTRQRIVYLIVKTKLLVIIMYAD